MDQENDLSELSLSEYFGLKKEASREKRASNRENSAEYLTQREIPFTSKNQGAHLIVEGYNCFIDFWPGTGKWHSRCGIKGFGVRNLVEFIKRNEGGLWNE